MTDNELRKCEIRDCTDEAEYRFMVTDRGGGCSPLWLCEQCRSAYLLGKMKAKEPIRDIVTDTDTDSTEADENTRPR